MNFQKIESKWQKKWESKKIFQTKKSKKKKFYCLEMYPYPSGEGLHLGHVCNFVIGDVYARFKRMQGFNVLYPMGYDSFGLPAENAAIKNKTHPKIYTEKAIKNFTRQQKEMGLSYDWSRTFASHHPDFYKWDQWIFLQLYKKGLAYKKKAAVNWCPKCNTVLANEQVVNGRCWRHTDTEVEIKELNQWFFKITDYAEKLLKGLDKLKDWPEDIKTMQRNWIGKSQGTQINFKIKDTKEIIPIFTTRIDTIYGVTFLVFAPEHPKVLELVKGTKYEKPTKEFIKKVILKDKFTRTAEDTEKEGLFIGKYAINPLTNEEVPIYIGNFVLLDYGGGAVMAVPAHDQRDYEFAKKYNIPIKGVIKPVYGEPNKKAQYRKTVSAVIHRKKDNKFLLLKWKKFNWISPIVGGIEDGEDLGKAAEREVLEETGYKVKFISKLGGEVESHFYADNKDVWRHRVDQPVLLELIQDKAISIDKEEKERHEAIWLTSEEALKKMTHEDNKTGILHYLNKHGAYISQGILINSKQFNGLNNKKAIEKITDHLKKKKLGGKSTQYKLRDWLISRQRYWGCPIPIVYCDKCGIVPVPEKDLPVKLPEKVQFGKENPLKTNKKFVNAKCPKCKGKATRETDTMDTFIDSSWYFFRYCDSKNKKQLFDKSKVNYWMPIDKYVGGKEHAIGHLIYSRFITKFFKDIKLINFDEPITSLFNQGMLHKEGVVMSKSKGNIVTQEEVAKKYGIDTARFFLMFIASPDKDKEWSTKGIEGSYRAIMKIYSLLENKPIKETPELQNKIHKTIKDVTKEIEDFNYNITLIKIMDYVNYLHKKGCSKNSLETLAKLITPFTPHLAEEIWSKLKHKTLISTEQWPRYDSKKINPKFDAADKLIEQTINDMQVVLKLVQFEPKIIKIFVSESWKYDLFKKIKKEISKTRNPKDIIQKVMDKEHSKDIAQIVISLIKDPNKIPEIILDQKKEISILKDTNLPFNTKIEIIPADMSTEIKAKQASPGKVAILVE